jgi:hypothetical protein
VLAILPGYVGVFWLMWKPLARPIANGTRIDAVMKDYYLADQVDYLAISRNVSDGSPAYVEPYSETGDAVYPSAYYWILGLVDRYTPLGVIGAWNVVGMAMTVAVLLAVGAWCRWASGSWAGWALGPLPFLVGTLQAFTGGGWLSHHGSHAVIWPAFAILFNPGAEVPALLFAGVSLYGIVRSLAVADVRTRLRWIAVSGVASGIVVNLHTYVAIFTVLACVGSLATWTLLAERRRWASHRWAGVTVASALLFWLIPSGSALPRLGVLFAALACLVAIESHSRRELGVPFAVYLVTAGAIGLPVIARTALQALDPNSFVNLRQQWATDVDLTVPPVRVLLESAPILALAAVCFVWLWRQRSALSRAWAAGLAAVFGVGALLTFNRAWGLNQEPYRFYPYTLFLLSIAAAPVLAARAGRTAKPLRLARVAVAIALLATLWTTTAFYGDTTVDAAVAVSPGERAAYRAIATALPRDGLVLLDVCLPPGVFKLTTGAAVAFYNRGLAIPRDFGPMSHVLDGLKHGELASDDMLAAAGISAFVTQTSCNSPQLEDRFDAPIARIPFPDAVTCGLLEGTEYVVYRVRSAPRHGPVSPVVTEPDTPWPPFKPGQGEPAPGTSPRCTAVGGLA